MEIDCQSWNKVPWWHCLLPWTRSCEPINPVGPEDTSFYSKLNTTYSGSFLNLTFWVETHY